MTDKDKWVDSSGYFGPDRRRRGGKRWGDRRVLDEAAKPPPLGAMMRRLRVQMLGLSTADDRRHTLQILAAAITEAERLRYYRCADSLKQADQILRTSGDPQAADVRLTEAANHAAAQR